MAEISSPPSASFQRYHLRERKSTLLTSPPSSTTPLLQANHIPNVLVPPAPKSLNSPAVSVNASVSCDATSKRRSPRPQGRKRERESSKSTPRKSKGKAKNSEYITTHSGQLSASGQDSSNSSHTTDHAPEIATQSDVIPDTVGSTLGEVVGSDSDYFCSIKLPQGVSSPDLYYDVPTVDPNHSHYTETHASASTNYPNPKPSNELHGHSAPLPLRRYQSLPQQSTSPNVDPLPSIAPQLATAQSSAAPPSKSSVQIGHMTSKGGRDENQDSYLFHTDCTPYILALCDGHGPRGREAAVEATKSFVTSLKRYFRNSTPSSCDAASSPPAPSTPPTPLVTPSSSPADPAAPARLSNPLSRQRSNLSPSSSSSSSLSSSSNSLLSLSLSDAQAAEAIRTSFSLAHDRLIARCLRTQLDYGTTACVALVYKNSVAVGWAGDSRVILYSSRLGGPDLAESECSTPRLDSSTGGHAEGERLPTGVLYPTQLSCDHVPKRPDERERIEAAGGRVIERRSRRVIPPPSEVSNSERADNKDSKTSAVITKPAPPLTQSTWRVIPSASDYTDAQISRDKLALNISRALGHIVLSRYGVSPVPDVAFATLEEGDILLLCSDGLWNEISNEEIGGIIARHGREDLHKISAVLTREAEARCKLKNIASDNITVLMYRHCLAGDSHHAGPGATSSACGSA